MTIEMSPPERAKNLIDTKTNMTLATVDVSGVPWVSPVFYVPDEAYHLYWTSWVDAKHSENVRNNPAVAIVIHHAERNEPVDAVYIAAQAVELNDPDDVTRGMEIMGRRDDLQPEWWRIDGISDVTGSGPWRIYRAAPQTIEVRKQIEVAGKRVVTREPADFRTSGS